MSSIDPLKFTRRLRRRKRLEDWLQHQKTDKPYPEPSRPKDIPPQDQQQQTSDGQDQRLQGRRGGRQPGQPQDRVPGQIGGREDLRASRRKYWRKVNSVSAIR